MNSPARNWKRLDLSTIWKTTKTRVLIDGRITELRLIEKSYPSSSHNRELMWTGNTELYFSMTISSQLSRIDPISSSLFSRGINNLQLWNHRILLSHVTQAMDFNAVWNNTDFLSLSWDRCHCCSKEVFNLTFDKEEGQLNRIWPADKTIQRKR